MASFSVLWLLTRLLLVLGAAAAAVVARWVVVLDQVEGSSILSVVRLALQGSLQWTRLTFRRPVTIDQLQVVQPERLGGQHILDTKCVRVSSLRALFTGRHTDITADGVKFNALGGDDGLLHVVALLQDVKFWREERKPQKPDRIPKPKHVNKQVAQLSQATNGLELKEDNGGLSHFPSAEVGLSAELDVLHLHITAEEGVVLLPMDIKAMLGDEVRVHAVVGQDNLHRCASERLQGKDSSWIRNRPTADSPSGRGSYPLAAYVQASGLELTARAWRTKSGFWLPHPIRALVGFTPALAKFGFARFAPLIQNAVSMEQRQDVECTIEPLNQHLPADCVTLRLAPMRLHLATSGIMGGLMRLLNFRGQNPELDSKAIQAWTGEAEALYYRSGLVESRRMDLLVGRHVHQGQGGLQLCMWGKVDTANNNALDMTVGLPARTLNRLGIRTIIDPLYVMTIAVKGTAQHPEIDVMQAVKDLTALFVQQGAAKQIPILSSLLRRKQRKSDGEPARMTGNGEGPPPAKPLPWQDNEVPDDEVSNKDSAAEVQFPQFLGRWLEKNGTFRDADFCSASA